MTTKKLPFKLPDFYMPWPARMNPHLQQGVFILGGKKEKKSDLLLIKLPKDHYFLSFKIC